MYKFLISPYLQPPFDMLDEHFRPAPKELTTLHQSRYVLFGHCLGDENSLHELRDLVRMHREALAKLLDGGVGVRDDVAFEAPATSVTLGIILGHGVFFHRVTNEGQAGYTNFSQKYCLEHEERGQYHLPCFWTTRNGPNVHDDERVGRHLVGFEAA